MTDFISQAPELEDYWRGIILLGRNVASYKFALAQSLLELKPYGGQLVTLEEIAPVFSWHICEHLQTANKQATSRSSSFLDTCRNFNEGNITQDDLVTQTVRKGFANVIDAFHVVGTADVPVRFFLDERKSGGGIKVTDEFSQLMEVVQARNLPKEVNARWRLVESAWELGMSSALIAVEYDCNDELLYRSDTSNRRKAVTSCRDALNGYQKGKCFYCFDDISISDPSMLPDVDHFFAHKLKQFGMKQLDGVWNLVLACTDCNRGVNGKFEKLPTLRLLERLNHRNEFLIASKHPLRETLMLQTGDSSQRRRTFLNDYYNEAWKNLLQQWEPEQKGRMYF